MLVEKIRSFFVKIKKKMHKYSIFACDIFFFIKLCFFNRTVCSIKDKDMIQLG